MIKTQKSISHIFVNKVNESNASLWTRDELMRFWLRSGGSKSRIAHAISHLIGSQILVRIARDLYIRTNVIYREIYWEIVARLIEIHAPGGAMIGAEKALEIHMMNYSIPETLVLYTRDTSVRIRLTSGEEIHFRSLHSGAKSGKKNLFTLLSRHTEKSILHEKIGLPCPEIALLEALSLRRHDSGIDESLVLRFLRQNAHELDIHIIAELAEYRYIHALNRLRRIALREGFVEIYANVLAIIKNEGGGCFLSY